VMASMLGRRFLAAAMGRGHGAVTYKSSILFPSPRYLSNSMAGIPTPALLLPQPPPSLGTLSPMKATNFLRPILRPLDDLLSLLSPSWFIKRTFQPSIIKRKRTHGFLARKKTVGGRRVLKRRLLKGRTRLAC